MKIVIALAALLVLVLLSMPIGAVLGGLGFFLAQLFSQFPLHNALGDIAWSASSDFILIAVPLFIFMGEILLRSGIAGRMFKVMSGLFARFPGGLLHANIGTAALFAATSGSSVATAATIATVATPEMERGGYRRSTFLGSIAAGGTLGILIPPSINMIVYGVLAEVSIRDLYVAAVIPGIVLAAIFGVVVIVLALLNPEVGGHEIPTPFRDVLKGAHWLLPPAALFLVVVGSIYAGIATPSEAAALGVVATLILAATQGSLSIAIMVEACLATMRTTAMVMLIIIAAFFLNFVLSSTGITSAISSWMIALDWGPLATLSVIIAIYLVLGCFMETLTLMVATTPIVVPIIVGLGYDPVWFGVLFMVLIEAALITPPIGMNLFVVQAIYPRATSAEIAGGAAPFLLGMFLMIVLLVAFPGLALGLL
jgi:C4-dicarboxylate transporter DctM subunit